MCFVNTMNRCIGHIPYAFTSAASCEVRVRVRDRSRSPACWISWRFLSTCGSSDTASVSAASCSACCRSSPKPSASIPLKREECVSKDRHYSNQNKSGRKTVGLSFSFLIKFCAAAYLIRHELLDFEQHFEHLQEYWRNILPCLLFYS